MVYPLTAPLYSIIMDKPDLLSLLNRLGIFLGVGNDTIEISAEKHGIDPVFLLAMINTYTNPEYFPEKELRGFPITRITDYLLRANRFYIDVALPNVIRHFQHLVQRSVTSDNNIQRLFDFFKGLKCRMEDEIQRYNVLLEKLSTNHNKELIQEIRTFGMEQLHPLTDSIQDLISLFIIHLKGSYEPNLCHAVINALISLRNDLRQNIRIHDRILTPLTETAIHND